MLLVADLMASSFQPYTVSATPLPESEDNTVIEENMDAQQAEDPNKEQDADDQKLEGSEEGQEIKDQESNSSESQQETEQPQGSEEGQGVEEGKQEVAEDTGEKEEQTTATDGVAGETSTEEVKENVTPVQTPKAVMIGDVGYETLQEAVREASANDTITLVDHVTVDDTIVINKNITIISKTQEAKEIRRGSDFRGYMFKVTDGAQLRLGNAEGTNAVIVDGGAKWVMNTIVSEDVLEEQPNTGEENKTEEVGSNQEETATESTQEPVTEENSTESTQEQVQDTTEAEVADTEKPEENVEMAQEETTTATEQEVVSEEANMQDEVQNVQEQNSKMFAFALKQKIVTVEVDSPNVKNAYNNGITADASMIQITNGQVYVNKNTVVQNNDTVDTTTGGGAISNTAGGKGTVFVYGTIQNNRANANGGAIHNNGFVNVYDGAKISGNQASKNGGAIENYSGGVMAFQGGTFENNQAELGGAIWTDGKLDVQGGTYENNEASVQGGAIFVNSQNDSRRVAFSNGTFTNNRASEGEDIYLGTEFATFQGNVQLQDVFLKNGNSLKVTNTVNGTIGVTYENPELDTTIATGKGYTLKDVDAKHITSNVVMYQTALQDGSVKLVYAPVVIDSQPQNTKGDIADGATLSIVAHAKSNTEVTYQWYESDTPTGENGVAVENATNATYQVQKEGTGLYYYYCVVQAEKAAETRSDVVTVKMTDRNSAEVPTILSQPVGGTYDLQKEVTMTVEAKVEDGGELSYQWYKALNPDLSDKTLIPDATDKTYTMNTTEAGTFYYYCVVTNTRKGIANEVATAQSNVAVITVNGVALRFNGIAYSTMEDVLPYLQQGEGTLEVLRDVTLNKTITVEKGDLVIKGENGKAPVITLDKSLTKQAFIVNGGTLTLENVVLDGGAVWTGDVNNYLQRGVRNAGRQVNVPAITMNGGVVNLEKGSVLRNHVVSWDVSGIKMSAGTLNINGGSLLNNYGGNHGGAIFADSSNSIINMTSGTISGNQARQSTGAICADHGAQLHISGGEISNNYTSGRAGAIYINGTLVVSDNAHIHDNRADANGGAIVNTAGTMSIRGGEISNNSAGENGGGIASLGGIINLQGGKIQNNKAVLGSGIYIEPAVTIAGELALDGVFDDIYTSRVYTMTLDGNGADNPKNQTIRFLSKYDLPTMKRNGYQFLGWYTQKEDGEKIQSGDWIKATKNITVYARWELTATDEIQLSKQPEGGVFYIEDGQKLSVKASTKNNAEVSYQWYRSTDAKGTTKSALKGETKPTLSLPTELGTYYYFCVVSAKNAVDVTSNIVKVQMISKDVAYTPEFVKQPQTIENYVGERAVFEAEATTVDKGTITYQWYRSQDGVANLETAEKIEGATGMTYEVEPTQAGVFYYFVVVTNTIQNQKGEDTTAVAISDVARLVSHNRITVKDIKADDTLMQKKYWNSYRIDMKESKDGYITDVKSPRGSWGNNTLNKAFDGNWGTFWETNSSGANNAVEITFDKEVNIDRIIYATRQDSQKGKGYPLTLTIYSKNANGVYEEVGVAQSTETGGYRMFTLPKTITTTGLKFAFTKGAWNWASASEIVLLRSEDTVLSGCATVFGTAIPGSQLSVTTDVITGSKDHLTYQWQESKDGVEYTDIQGENEEHYTIKETDARENKYLRVVVSDTSGKYAGTMVTEPYRSLVDVALEGTPKVGETLKPVMSYVGDKTTYEYQWQKSSDGIHFEAIKNSTEETYMVDNTVASQYVRLAVKVQVEGNPASYTVYSNAVHVDIIALMTGAPQVGSTLKASVRGMEEQENNVIYTWEIGDSEEGEFAPIADATAVSYTVKDTDLNRFIRLKAMLTESKETVISEAWQVQEAGTIDDLDGDYVYLSNINKKKLLDYSVGYGKLMYDKNINGGRISLLVNGENNYFLKGIGAHANAHLLYDLSDYVKYYHYDRFIAYLGLDHSQGSYGNGVKFTIQTSADKNTWTTQTQTKVLKGNTDAIFVDIPLEDAKYLRINIDSNGSNAADHSVIADAKLANIFYDNNADKSGGLIKRVSEYDKELKAFEEKYPEKNVQDLLEMPDYKKLLYQRTFVSDAGYNVLKTYLDAPQYVKTLEWFMNDMEALDLYVGGGKAAGSYVNFVEVLTKLYNAHGDDFEKENGSLYKKMIITLALTHSTDVWYWAGGSVKSDALKRYEIFKHMYDNGVLITNVFENLTVEEMRWVMNSVAGDDELEWANYYLRHHTKIKNIPEDQLNVKNFTPGPYYFITYTFNYNYNQEKYYSAENKEYWQKKYSLTNETAEPKDERFNLDVTYQAGKPKMWIVWEEGAVCGGISKTGNSLLTSFGVPGGVVTQPGHAAYLQYSYLDPNSGADGIGTWSLQNDVFGWTKTVRYQRMLCGWGSESWTSYYQGSYLMLGQAAINDEANYFKANNLVRLADVYADDAQKQIDLYEQALKVQSINMDAWVGLINAYTKAGKTEADFVQLAKRISEGLTYYPLPMKDILENLIKQHITSVAGKTDVDIYVETALKKASKANDNNTVQSGVCRTMANYLLGNSTFKMATFSFDGERAGKIVLDESYSAGNELLYSLDGGKEWKSGGVTTEIQLTKDELASITEENDILVKLQGATSYYTIDITKANTPSNLYKNDAENRLIGTVDGLEWCSKEGNEWKTLTSDTTFEGDQVVQVRKKATGTVKQSEIAIYTFTQDTDTASRKYIPLKYISYVGTSSEEVKQNGNATNALDGKLNTIWHTLWAGGDNERYITVKFDEPRYLTSINYTPRQSGSNGRFLDAEVYVSMDGEDWMLAGTANNWADNAKTKVLNLFGPTYAQYVKVVGKRTVGNFGSADMLEFFEDTTVESKTVTSIELKTAPKKRSYLLGDELNKKGLVVIAHYDDGTKSTLKHKFLQFDKTIFDTVGTQTISVSYSLNGDVKPVTFDVEVQKNTKAVTGIKVTQLPEKMRYFVGDSLNTEGMKVKAQYEDGTEGYIFDGMYQVVPETFTKATSSQDVTIQYTKGDTTVTDTFSNVEVTKVVKAIQITTKPSSLVHNLGDSFHDKGMKVSVVYDDNTKEVLDPSEYEIESDGFSNTSGTKNITITYIRRPEIQTSLSVIVFPYIQTEQFIFEAVEGKDTAYVSYIMPEKLSEDGRVEIPDSVTVADKLRFKVTGINRSSFEGQTNVKSVVIPNTVESIEQDAFKNSTELKEVYLIDYDNFDHFKVADTAFSGVTGGTVYVANHKLVKELEAKNIKGLKNLTIKSITEKVVDLEVTAPNKTEYVLGEQVDFTGLTVTGILDDGSRIALNSEAYTMNAFDRNKAGVQEMTVHLAGKEVTKSFTLTVTPPTPSIEKQPMSVAYDKAEQPKALTVTVSTKDEGHLRYQWYSNTTNSIDGATAIQDATSDSYVPELKEQYYFVVVTNNDATNTEGTGVSVTSDIAYVQVGSYEARIRNQSYATLKEAVDTANDGATIQMIKDVTVGATITINKNLTISGHTIKRASGFKEALFQVNKGIVLLEDVTVDGGAVWLGNSNSVLQRDTKNTGINANNALFIVNGGELNLGKGSSLENNSNASKNYARSGGAVRLEKGTLRMTGGAMKNNYSDPFGGAVLALDGSVILESGLVSGNEGTSSGGVFCIDRNSNFIMEETSKKEDLIIENNLGLGNGGVIWLSNGKATLHGGIIRNNKGDNGGAVYMNGTGTLELGDVTMVGNRVSNMADGIYYANGTIQITGTPNTDNAIYMTNGKQIKIKSDLTNIASKIRLSIAGANSEGGMFAVADTKEQAQSATNAFTMGGSGFSLYAEDVNVYYGR